jgi:hypothetical protein
VVVEPVVDPVVPVVPAAPVEPIVPVVAGSVPLAPVADASAPAPVVAPVEPVVSAPVPVAALELSVDAAVAPVFESDPLVPPEQADVPAARRMAAKAIVVRFMSTFLQTPIRDGWLWAGNLAPSGAVPSNPPVREIIDSKGYFRPDGFRPPGRLVPNPLLEVS